MAAQTGKKTSLIVTNCEETERVCETQHLYRYNFVDGEYAGKEKILTAKTSDLRLDIGGNRIYRNRFLIDYWGDVIDLNAKTVLHKGNGELVEINGDEVVIEINRVDQEGIFAYNLESGKYTKIKSPNIYESDGAVSPDKKYIASRKNSSGLVLKETGSGKAKIIKGDFAVMLSVKANEFGQLPLFWLDNERLLTQRSNGEIIIVHTNGKIEPVVKIDIKESPYTSPVFSRDPDGEIIYECDESFVIDIDNKKFKKYESVPIGNGFLSRNDETAKSNWGTGTVYFYKGAEIGRIWSAREISTDNFLAVIYGKDGSNLGYPDGVKVWNSFKKDWTTLEIKWKPEIVGWISE